MSFMLINPSLNRFPLARRYTAETNKAGPLLRSPAP